jgi:hypothetical protein
MRIALLVSIAMLALAPAAHAGSATVITDALLVGEHAGARPTTSRSTSAPAMRMS